jgi:4-diphosphocytidyl-2-C-methyl-D-erythritol kinase
MCRGRGEILTTYNLQLTTYKIVLVVPDIQVSTKWAYEEWDKKINPKSQIPNPDRITNHESRITDFENDFEKIVIPQYSVIQEIKDRLLESGAVAASMSGSGPSVFGIFKNREDAQLAYDTLKRDFGNTFICDFVGHGLEII